MFAYTKNPPTTYVLHHQNGRVRREGPGLDFWYFRPASTIVAIPLASRDVPFAFGEVTADFQPVTLQGQLTYRITDPRRVAGLLDFKAASIVAGVIEHDEEIVVESLMPSGGVIFSDGIESDYLEFNAGAIGRARAAGQRAMLVVAGS